MAAVRLAVGRGRLLQVFELLDYIFGFFGLLRFFLDFLVIFGIFGFFEIF